MGEKKIAESVSEPFMDEYGDAAFIEDELSRTELKPRGDDNEKRKDNGKRYSGISRSIEKHRFQSSHARTHALPRIARINLIVLYGQKRKKYLTMPYKCCKMKNERTSVK